MRIAEVEFPGWAPKGTRVVACGRWRLLMVPRTVTRLPEIVRSYEVRTLKNRPLGMVTLWRREGEPPLWRATDASWHAGELGWHRERRGALASLLGAYAPAFLEAVA